MASSSQDLSNPLDFLRESEGEILRWAAGDRPGFPSEGAEEPGQDVDQLWLISIPLLPQLRLGSEDHRSGISPHNAV